MSPGTSAKQTVGRYALHQQIASGGMATVHVGRLMGPVGFARTVAIKRLHSHFANDPEFVAMFMDEAHLAARIRHPNVVSISDVVAEQGELLLVMDYIAGESLSKLVRANRQQRHSVDPRIVIKVMTDALAGLHAAHEVTDEDGLALGVVHRDVSPQNILVGSDGVARLIDFGVAKAAGRIQTTREGQLKGKLGYMAPEQIELGVVDRRTDIYSAAVVLWEALTSERLFSGAEANLMYSVLHSPIEPPSSRRADLSPELDSVVMRALARDPAARYASALDLADALEDAVAPASSREVARWVQTICADALRSRGEIIAEVESDSALFMEPKLAAAAERRAPPEQPTTIFATPGGARASWPSQHSSAELQLPPLPPGNNSPNRDRVKFGVLAATVVLLAGVLTALVVQLLRGPASGPEVVASDASVNTASSLGVASGSVGPGSVGPGSGENDAGDPAETPSESIEAATIATPDTLGAPLVDAAPLERPTPKPATHGNGLSGAQRKEKYGF